MVAIATIRAGGSFLNYLDSSEGAWKAEWIGHSKDLYGYDAEVTENSLLSLFDQGASPNPAVHLSEESTSEDRNLGAPITERGTVTGYELIVPLPRSVSILWALGGEEAQMAIDQAHDETIHELVDYFERKVASAVAGPGDVEHHPVAKGVGGVRIQHYENTRGLPHLHNHLLISIKVKIDQATSEPGVFHQRWAKLNGRGIHRSAEELSAVFDRALLNRVCHALGLETVERELSDGTFVPELAGVDVNAMDKDALRNLKRKRPPSLIQKIFNRWRQGE